MADLILTYFDINGGRGEPARLAMHLGQIEFQDRRFPFSDFSEVRKSTPLSQVPTLTIDGHQITQCNAINRYIAKQANLYPNDPFQALLCDEVMDALEDLTHALVATFGMQGEELKKAREAFIANKLTRNLTWLANKLDENGGVFFADNRLTIADLKVFVSIRSFNSGHLEHIPTDIVESFAPSLNAHNQRIAQLPLIAEYYAEE